MLNRTTHIYTLASFVIVACCILLSNTDASKMGHNKSHKKGLKKISPKPSPQSPPTYATIAAAATAYNLTTLVQVVSMTPLLAAATSGTTAMTVFAPTNTVRERK